MVWQNKSFFPLEWEIAQNSEKTRSEREYEGLQSVNTRGLLREILVPGPYPLLNEPGGRFQESREFPEIKKAASRIPVPDLRYISRIREWIPVDRAYIPGCRRIRFRVLSGKGYQLFPDKNRAGTRHQEEFIIPMRNLREITNQFFDHYMR
jgi:hypothetical protein